MLAAGGIDPAELRIENSELRTVEGSRNTVNRATFTRRNFFRAAAIALGAGLLAAFHSLTDRTTAVQRRPRRVTLPADLAQDVTFVDAVIVCRTDAGIRAMSARCTHLGCTITHQADGLLVCPCHGSRFHLDGRVAGGPATRALEVLPCRLDRATGTLVVEA